MSDGLALLVVAAIVVAAWLLSRLPVWRRCRCGDRICNGCGRHR